MGMIILIGFLLAVFCFPSFRCLLCHPFGVLYYGVKDLYYYFAHKQANLCHSGELVSYVGLFGKGKTLSAVHRVVGSYKRYDGKTVWHPGLKKFVTQRVKILSNVNLNVPYENLVSLEQVVLCAKRNSEEDKEQGTLTVTLVLGDEFSVQMNSRNFKSNIDPLFLNTLLTCRHYHISLFYTSQRFGHVDALLRQVTSAVVDCNKLWRFQRQNVYDAWELENATNPALLTPRARGCWFVKDKDYAAYDTLACVGNLTKAMKDGDMMTEEQILALQCNQQQPNMEGIVKPSRRFLRAKKKEKK